jgi:hypothetical protein
VRLNRSDSTSLQSLIRSGDQETHGLCSLDLNRIEQIWGLLLASGNLAQYGSLSSLLKGEFHGRLLSSDQESSEFVPLELRSIDCSGWVVYKVLIVYIYSDFISMFSTVNSFQGPKSGVRQKFSKPQSSPTLRNLSKELGKLALFFQKIWL